MTSQIPGDLTGNFPEDLPEQARLLLLNSEKLKQRELTFSTARSFDYSRELEIQIFPADYKFIVFNFKQGLQS